MTDKLALEAVDRLARQLVWIQNRLDPQPDDCSWEEMDERDKGFFRACIHSVLADKETVMEALAGQQDGERNTRTSQ